MALISFLGLGMELVIIFLETMIYGIGMKEYTYTMNCMHLVYTILVWSAFIIGLIHYSKKKNNFDIFKYCNKPSLKGFVIVICILIIITIWQYIDWGGIKIIKEFQSKGLLEGVLQHIYYIFETGLVILIIIFGQKYGEGIFRNTRIPYGGVLLAVTWGQFICLLKI